MTKSNLIALGFVCCLCSFPVMADTPAPAAKEHSAPVAVDKFRLGSKAYQAGQYARARELWQPLAENGNIHAQYAIGRMHEKGNGVERNFETAISWYRKAAEHGHADSEYRIAVGYAYGLGVKRDEAEGLAWLRRAANHGQKRAQKVLAQAYEEGRLGLKADPELAKYWYDKAGSGS
ncbi:MAG: sel1 repeat family protein [Sulfuricaulis sp.]|nr:sel1 repeat family protein [Sulfuricaulis sp.]